VYYFDCIDTYPGSASSWLYQEGKVAQFV